LPEILRLQKSAFLSEAIALNNHNIEPLTQTLEEMEKVFARGIVLKKTDEKTGEIVGSVRAREENDRVSVMKLMVRPDFQNKGIGTSLLKEIESLYENKTFELFTNAKNEKNMRLYLKNGYREVKRTKESDDLEFAHFEK
jgi:ribosomal protein S18 acetylase RimI-like enzyme